MGEEFEQVCAAIRAGHSVLVLSEAGTGAMEFARALFDRFAGEFDSCIATYKGSGKTFFKAIAEQLDIPTTEPKYNSEGEEVGEKPLTMDGLKEEIAQNVGENTLLIFPEAKRLTTGIRYWLEDLIASGVKVACLAIANPQRDIFLDMIEIELPLPGDAQIRSVMESEARAQGLSLSKSRLAELQPLAGRNPMLARKVIRNERLGIKQTKPEHTQYVVIMPIIIACLMSFGIIRFVGMGTGNKSLYIFGGTTLVAGMTLKQLGSIRGARKKLGQ